MSRARTHSVVIAVCVGCIVSVLLQKATTLSKIVTIEAMSMLCVITLKIVSFFENCFGG